MMPFIGSLGLGGPPHPRCGLGGFLLISACSLINAGHGPHRAPLPAYREVRDEGRGGAGAEDQEIGYVHGGMPPITGTASVA